MCNNNRSCLKLTNPDYNIIIFVLVVNLDPGGGGGGTPIWNRRGCSSEILNLTPKGDHLGVA